MSTVSSMNLRIRLGVGMTVALALLSLAIAIYPDPPARALLTPSDIFIDSGFVRTDPPKDFEVRASILQSPDLVLWRTWNPTDGSVPGDAHSAPFHMPAHLVIPYQGFAGDDGIRIQLECLGSAARIDVATARTNNQWAESLVRRPRNWCEGDTRLLVHSSSRANYMAFGTPFRISTVSWFKKRFLGLFGTFLLLFGAVAGGANTIPFHMPAHMVVPYDLLPLFGASMN